LAILTHALVKRLMLHLVMMTIWHSFVGSSMTSIAIVMDTLRKWNYASRFIDFIYRSHLLAFLNSSRKPRT
jgi:hypothetical protein